MQLLFSFTVGGAEKLVVDLSNQLIKRGHEVHVYVVNDLYDESMLELLSDQIKVVLQKRAVSGHAKIKTIKCITKYIKDERIEIVHCNSFSAPNLLCLKPMFLKKTKVVQTIHDIHYFDSLSKKQIKFRNYIVNNFIAISESVFADIGKHGIESDKIEVVYNAIDISKFSQRKKKKTNSQFIIANVARIMPEKKGQDILIRAIAEIKKIQPKVECWLVGNEAIGYEGTINELKKLSEELGVYDNIKFLGNIENIPELLNKIDLFVLPSRFEGFGISLIEAMAMEVPCIASNLDGPAEIIGKEERGYLFEKENVEMLADKILYVMNNRDVSETKKRKARRYVEDNFNIINMTNKILKIYQK